MSRDYAKQQPSPKRPARAAKPRPAMPGWLWAVCGLTVGLCIAAVVFIVLRPVEKTSVAVQAAPESGKAKVAAPAIPAQTESRFKFYDLLPKYEIKPSEEAYKVTPPPAPSTANSANGTTPAAASNARYLIQAGSFLNADDAERRKASIALIGIESSVAKVNVDGKGTRYRIQIGPSRDYQQAQKIMRQLADNDIDSFATRSDG